MARSANEIAQELNATGLNQQQLTLLVELLAAKTIEVEGGKTKRKIKLPDDWEPTDDHYLWAKSHGKDTFWVDSIAEDMRNWAASKGEKRTCWNGTLSTFMKRALTPRPTQASFHYPNGSQRLGGGYA